MATVYLNGVTIETYGVVVTALSGWLDVPAYSYPMIELVGVPGQSPVGVPIKVAPREMTVSCYLNTATTYLERRQKLAALALACQGQIEFATDEDPNRICYTVLLGGSGSGILEQALANPYALITLKLLAPDPHWYQKMPTVIPLPTGEREPLPLGSAPCRGRINVNHGGSGSGTVGAKLRHASGTILGQLTFTGVTLATDDSVEIDCQSFRAWRYLAATNVWSDITSTMSAGQDFFVFDPLDQPTLELDNGYDGWVAYRKAEMI